ncbi:hypothetical protein FA13DRAFT_57904 [Coprinellus micaceus]|uniref:Uncharacterized protein n=1 Tax=Coprinellus micaceus TaxID=71717 RepID=A0A4Y7U159_COPMI|nr:hypothetical protein FA13DRAFT_57904 [Coprinellus micaceus]
MELRIASYPSPRPWSHPPSSWHHFHRQAQSSLLRLLSAPRIRVVHLEALVDISAKGQFDLVRLTQFTAHNIHLYDDTSAQASSAEHGGPHYSDLQDLQISGGDVVGTLRWIDSQNLWTSQLRRLSITSTISYTLWSANDMMSIQRLISSSPACLRQVDIRLDDYDHSTVLLPLHHTVLRCV